MQPNDRDAGAGRQSTLGQHALAEFFAGRPGLTGSTLQWTGASEFPSLLLAWGGVLSWSLLSFLYWDASLVPSLLPLKFLTLVAPPPLAVLLGFLAGKRRTSSAVGAMVILVQAPTLFHLASSLYPAT